MAHRIIRSLEVTKGDATHLEIELRYDLGGMNYFTGKTVERGLKLSVKPVRNSVSECGKYKSQSFTAFTGISKHLLDMARFNQKKFDSYEVEEATITELVNYVKSKEGIETKE